MSGEWLPRAAGGWGALVSLLLVTSGGFFSLWAIFCFVSAAFYVTLLVPVHVHPSPFDHRRYRVLALLVAFVLASVGMIGGWVFFGVNLAALLVYSLMPIR